MEPKTDAREESIGLRQVGVHKHTKSRSAMAEGDDQGSTKRPTKRQAGQICNATIATVIDCEPVALCMVNKRYQVIGKCPGE